MSNAALRSSNTKTEILPPCLKAGTYQPNRWTSEAFGETRTRSGTNMFGVFKCVGSLRSHTDVVCSDSTCDIWEGWPSEPLDSLIGGVLANQCGVWEGQNTVCALFFCAHRSVIPCFHVLEYWHKTSCYGELICSFGSASLHVQYAAVFFWNS